LGADLSDYPLAVARGFYRYRCSTWSAARSSTRRQGSWERLSSRCHRSTFGLKTRGCTV
jgi:hypothetical protein